MPPQLDVRSVPFSALTEGELAEWRRVQAADVGLATPYLTPEFSAAVASVRGDVRVAVLGDGGGRRAFWPHQRQGRVAYPVGGAFNDFQALVAPVGFAWRGDDLLRASGVACLHFDHWLADQGQLAGGTAARAPSPYADLRHGYTAYLAEIETRSDQMVKVGQRRRKLAREHGESRFVFKSTDRSALERVIQWKAQQFRRAGLPDPFAHEWTRELLVRLLATDTPALAGWLSTLHVGDRLVAAHMGMRSHDVLHYWFPVYDHDFHQYGPGLLLLVDVLQAAAADGIRRIDFGKGEDAWKPRFMTGSTAVVEGVLERPGLSAHFRVLCRAAAAALRRTPLRKLGAWPLRRLRYLAAQRRLRDA